jgi:hypothetical protein
MRARLLFLVALIVLTLPCMEVPDWAGMTGDPSNDFAVSPGTRKTDQALQIGASVATSKAKHPAFEVATNATAIDILRQGGHFSPGLLSIQRK